MKTVAKIKVKKKIKPRKLLFYLSIVALPLLQYCIFYIGVNANSILMAFQSYDAVKGEFYFDGLVNFKRIWTEFFGENRYLLKALGNSVMYYGITILTMVMSTFFSYYVYKKRRLSGLFRVVAFLPHIVSNITLVLIFKYFTESAYPAVVRLLTHKEDVWGLLANPDTVQFAVIFFCVFCGFGTQLLIISNGMSAIDTSISEAAMLDGVTPWQEFWKIDLPIVFPTVCTFIIVGVAGIFTNQMSLFSFFGLDADPALWTLGYYLYRGVQSGNMSEYGYLAALGLLFTLIVVPITFGVRKLLDKLDPNN